MSDDNKGEARHSTYGAEMQISPIDPGFFSVLKQR